MDKQPLADLPESSDKEFWGEAEVHTNLTPQRMFDEKHYFEWRRGHEAYCNHCGWGFALDAGDKVREGHVYARNGKLVI